MKKMTSGIDWNKVRAELDSQEWEPTDDGEGEERRVFLGTVMQLCPSGKYYMPWANSNLNDCSACHGNGKQRTVKRRVIKKWEKAKKGVHALALKNGLVGNVDALNKRGWYLYYRYAYRRLSGVTCRHCDGIGCREVYLDIEFNEALQSEAEERDLGICGSPGDPCDVFAVEFRSVQENDDHVA